MITRNSASAAGSDSTYDSKGWPAMIVERKHDYDRAPGGAKSRKLRNRVMPSLTKHKYCERDVIRWLVSTLISTFFVIFSRLGNSKL